MTDPIRLIDAFRHWKALPHQQSAANWLDDHLTAEQREQFGEMFRADPPIKPQPSPSPGKLSNPLKVPYFPQLDNGPAGWRQCQTSSIAMVLAFLQVPGIRDDVDYLSVVQRYGDTTDQAAHQKALASLKVRARFRQNMTPGDLMAELKAGLPVPIGVLHHGPVSAPSGGGHWITVIGYDDTSWIVHDPYGELDLVNGGWTQQGGMAGQFQRYSFRNLYPRWLPHGNDGWGWCFS